MEYILRAATIFLGLALCFTSQSSGASSLDEAVAYRTQKQYANALKIFYGLANAGDHAAQRHLGEIAFNGEGVTSNPFVAYEWLLLAANGGDSIAQYNLGYIFESGIGVEKDLNKALFWFERAGRKGYAPAYRKLGGLYQDTDPSAAYSWYSRALALGDETVRENVELLGARLNEVDQQRRDRRNAVAAAESRKQAQEYQERVERGQRAASTYIGRDLQQLSQQMSEQSGRIGAASRGTTVEVELANHERIDKRNGTAQSLELTATTSPEKKPVAVSKDATDYQSWRETCGGMCTREEYAAAMAEEAARRAKRARCVGPQGSCTTSK